MFVECCLWGFFFFWGVGWCLFLNIVFFLLILFVCKFLVIWYFVVIGLSVLFEFVVFNVWFVGGRILKGNLLVFDERFFLVLCFFLLNKILLCWFVLGLGLVVVLLLRRLFFVKWWFLVFRFLVVCGLFRVLFLLMGLNFFGGCLFLSGDR